MLLGFFAAVSASLHTLHFSFLHFPTGVPAVCVMDFIYTQIFFFQSFHLPTDISCSNVPFVFRRLSATCDFVSVSNESLMDLSG
jgi:hypothetical protein